MKLSNLIFSRLHWLNLPGALLITLLQRTPVVKVVATASEMLTASPAAQLLRSTVTAAALGAMHTLAGATTWRVVQGSNQIILVSSDPTVPVVRNPAVGQVGTPITQVGFTYTGTPSPPQFYQITGRLPNGLTFNPAANGATVPAGFPVNLIVGTPTVSGTFTVQIRGFGTGGNGQPEPIEFVISGPSAVSPAFTLQPVSQTVTAGSAVTFTAAASGSPAPTFQWRRDGNNLAGATAASLTLPAALSADAGNYTVIATNSAGSATSTVATLTVTAAEITSRLSNLSVRTRMTSGQILIVGSVMDGGSRDVLVRAVGPTLAAFGLANVMVDPRLDIFNGETLVAGNDDWPAGLAGAFASVGAFPLPVGSKDAALVQSIGGPRTIQARGTGGGVMLVEAYDLGSGNSPRLANVSARNFVGTGDDILIAGFNVAGTGTKRLLVRAVGPTLAGFGVSGTLVDPKLEIFTGAGVKVTENDTWDPGLSSTFSAVGAFQLTPGSKDAALITTLAAGGYTVQVRGSDGGTGEALIEIYEVK